MRWALAAASLAERLGEVPVGAVLVQQGVVLAIGFNHPISGCDPTLHAEIVALRAAARRVGNYRLPGASLYVTLEPCTMCVGAIAQARLKAVVFGAWEPKSGAAGSVAALLTNPYLVPHVQRVEGGVLARQCAAMMRSFFKARRK